MKKLVLLLPLACLAAFLSCNDSKNENTPGGKEPVSLLDSLEDQVWDGHDVGMAKYGKLRSMKLRAEQMIDSISRLPEKAKEEASSLRESLTALVRDLTSAKDNMDAWMRQYRDTKDSAKDNAVQREKFLRDEIIRVNKVRDDILNSLARADSLVK